MGDIATKVNAAGDWEGLYIGDDLAYENHTVSSDDMAQAFSNHDAPIDDTERMSIEIQSLGRTSLPSSLDTLETMLAFKQDVVDNVDEWETRLTTVLEEEFDDPPTAEEYREALDVSKDEFSVLTGLFMRRGIRTTKTHLDREAPIAYVDNSVTDPTLYTIAGAENARI